MTFAVIYNIAHISQAVQTYYTSQNVFPETLDVLTQQTEGKPAYLEAKDLITEGKVYQLGRLYAKMGNREKAEELLNFVTAEKEKKREKYQEKISGPD